ncbi:hypothetical protein QYF36_027040 [Acer negundo]|nr:hypothetical protein QYF36_027040 [Acer negundo]
MTAAGNQTLEGYETRVFLLKPSFGILSSLQVSVKLCVSLVAEKGQARRSKPLKKAIVRFPGTFEYEKRIREHH